jgi:hypothetical protein
VSTDDANRTEVRNIDKMNQGFTEETTDIRNRN